MNQADTNHRDMADTRHHRRREMPKGAHSLYITVTAVAFLALTTVFLCFPRTTYSRLEKRDLATFPEVDRYEGNPAGLTAAISQWFSDSEPFRDEFMTLSMSVRDAMRHSFGDSGEAVTFRPATPLADAPADETAQSPSGPLADAPANPLAEENAKIANSGIVIVGSGKNVRALMAFGGSEKAGKGFADLVNLYARTFPGVKVYGLVAPLATEFYLPAKAAKASRPQRPVIENIRTNLAPEAHFIDAYSALAAHVNEDIYLRTDHHWAPLGGFYAAKELARTAGVPFKELNSYDRHVIHDFVGSMYGYSKDISVKNAPEDFVYYTPKDIDYTTTFIDYRTDKGYHIVSESKPRTGPFFSHFKDGSGNAYLTFMGGDQHLVKVKTGTPGNRRVLIIKDSYGNTIPGYLFYSFNEVHVVDFRFFRKNMKRYIADNGITDIVFAFNIFNACNAANLRKVQAFLTQPDGVSASVAPAPKETPAKESAAKGKGAPTQEQSQPQTETPEASEPAETPV